MKSLQTVYILHYNSFKIEISIRIRQIRLWDQLRTKLHEKEYRKNIYIIQLLFKHIYTYIFTRRKHIGKNISFES